MLKAGIQQNFLRTSYAHYLVLETSCYKTDYSLQFKKNL